VSFFRRLKLPPVPKLTDVKWDRAAVEVEGYIRRLQNVLSAWPEDSSPVVVGEAIDGAVTIADSATVSATEEDDQVTFEVVDDSITDAKLRDAVGFSVIGRATTGSGETADIVSGTDAVLGRVGSGNLAFAQVATGQIAADAVTYAKIQNVSATSRFLGRVTAGAGDVEEVTPVQAVAILTISARPAQFTANQNNLAIAFGTNFISTDASRDFTGFVASTVDAQEAKLINVGTQNAVLKHLNAGSTSGNQIITPGGIDLTLTPSQACLLVYDLTSAKWRAFSY
jgi:hypothetical protein